MPENRTKRGTPYWPIIPFLLLIFRYTIVTATMQQQPFCGTNTFGMGTNESVVEKKQYKRVERKWPTMISN
jgi:hypothetical protein